MATDKTTREIEIIANGQKFNASLKEMTGAQSILNAQIYKMAADDPRRKDLIKDFQEMKRRAAEAKAEMNGVAQSQGFLRQAFASTIGNFLGGGILGAVQTVFSSVSGYLVESRKAFAESAQVNSQLESSLKSTAHAAGITKAEIEKLAEVRMGKTLFDDDATKGAASLLLTFTNIKKGVFEDAIPAIQDMAQKMAGDGPADLKGASIQIGKALNDPIKGITALSKVGVSFTEEQKATIKTMVAMGDSAGAQKLILAELNKEFGGSAEAARKAGGGFATLQMWMGEAMETVGGWVQGGLNRVSDFVTSLIDASDPLINVFKGLWAGITEVYDAVYDIISSLGLFNSEGSMATAIIEALSFAFTVMLTPLKITIGLVKNLIDGFVYFYNRSEMVRGVVGGLAAAVVSAFTSIKNAAVNILGGVGDLLVGIFSLDTEKIKTGLSKVFKGVVTDIGGNGARAGQAFVDGYVGAKDKRIVLSKKKDQQDAEEEVILAGAKGEKVANAETAAQKKAREKAAKEAEKERLKKEKELEKAREEFNKADAKATEELAKLKVAIMEEGVDKVLAKLRLQHAEERAELEQQKQAVLENAAATEAEKQALLENLKEQQRLKDKELQAAELQAKLTARDEEEALEKERLETKFMEDQLSMDDQAMRAGEAQMLRDEAELALHRATLAKKLADLVMAGDGETAAARKIRDEQLKLEVDKNEKIRQMTRLRLDNDRMMNQTRMQIGREAVDGLLGMLKEESDAYKVFKQIQKTIALAEIAMNLERELAANALAAAANPLNAVTAGAAGAAQLKLYNTLAYVRAGLSLGKVLAFEEGGYSKGGSRVSMQEVNGMWQMASGRSGGSIGTFADGGWVNNAQLGLIGERGAELVIPNWMISSPKYANTVSWLESERVKGATAFVEGGSTAPVVLPQPTSQEDSTLLLRMMLDQMGTMNETLKNWPEILQVHNNVAETQEKIKVLNGLIDKSGG